MGLTVREHLVLAYRVRFERRRLWSDMVDPRFLRPPSPAESERVDGLLELLNLTRVAKAPVAALPLGICRLVEVGRALAADPHVILLDEPLSGLDMKASESLLSVFQKVVEQADQAVSLLLVEHDVAAVLALSSWIFVLDFGERIAADCPEEIRKDPLVRAAYLGDDELIHTPTGSVERRPRSRRGMSEPILRVEGLDVHYGTSQALFGVSTEVARGSVLAVLGANGAGKSTLARTVSGLVPPSGGRVLFDGQDITGKPAHRIRKLGLTYIPEGRGIFPGLTVIDNLKMAVAQEKRHERAPAIDRAIDLFPVLGSRRTRRRAASRAVSNRCSRSPERWRSFPS